MSIEQTFHANGHSPSRPIPTEVFMAQAPAVREGNKWAPPIIDSLQTIQHIQKQFQEWAVPDEDPALVMKGMREETEELEEAIAGGNRRDIASELPDVFLQVCRLFNYYDIPMDIAISDKMARNAEKYNPAVIKEMREKEGKPASVAMSELKHKWDKSKDNSDSFCRSCGHAV